MQILRTEKVEGGYNVYLKDSDMVVFTHKEEEIKGLIKDGHIELYQGPMPKGTTKKQEKKFRRTGK